MSNIDIERIDGFPLMRWTANKDGKTYDFIIEDIPGKKPPRYLKGCKELYIRDSEFFTWQYVSPEFIEMLSEKNSELFGSLIRSFELIKKKPLNPKPVNNPF